MSTTTPQFTEQTIGSIDGFVIDLITWDHGEQYLAFWFNGEPYHVPADIESVSKMRDALVEALTHLRDSEQRD